MARLAHRKLAGMDDQLKQRLVGATILVVLAAIFVPMLFDSSEPSQGLPGASGQRDPNGAFPSSVQGSDPPADETTAAAKPGSPPAAVPETQPADPAPEPEAEPSAPSPAPEPRAAAPEPVPEPPADPPPQPAPVAEPEPKPEAQPKPEPKPKPEPAPANQPASAPASGDWVVQVASFNDLANAARLAQRMREKGFDAFTRKARVGERDVVRVYAGPVADRPQAERLGRDIESAFGESGLVVRNPAN